MRLPFLQVEADLLGAQGRVAAGMLRATPQQLVGYIAFMRAYVLGLSGDGEVTGLVRGPSSARVLALAAGWEGDPEAFVAALADPAVGLLEMRPEGVLVRGMEPYEKARKKVAASKERVRKSREARRLRATRAAVPRKDVDVERDVDLEKIPPKAPQGVLHVVAPASAAEKPADLMAAWNEHAHPDLPRCRELTEARTKKAQARLAERPLAEWVEAIQRMGRSNFLRGRTNSGTWRASFDWLLQPDSGVKILEGKYEDGAGAPKTTQAPTGSRWDWSQGLPPVNKHLVEELEEPF